MEKQEMQEMINVAVAASTAAQAINKGGVSDKSKGTAAALAFFLGVIGVHRFYLGYTGIGVAQILTFGGIGVWALVDFIMILTGNLKDSDGRTLA